MINCMVKSVMLCIEEKIMKKIVMIHVELIKFHPEELLIHIEEPMMVNIEEPMMINIEEPI